MVGHRGYCSCRKEINWLIAIATIGNANNAGRRLRPIAANTKMTVEIKANRKNNNLTVFMLSPPTSLFILSGNCGREMEVLCDYVLVFSLICFSLATNH